MKQQQQAKLTHCAHTKKERAAKASNDDERGNKLPRPRSLELFATFELHARALTRATLVTPSLRAAFSAFLNLIASHDLSRLRRLIVNHGTDWERARRKQTHRQPSQSRSLALRAHIFAEREKKWHFYDCLNNGCDFSHAQNSFRRFISLSRGDS